MLEKGEESLGAVILGSEAKSGINVPGIMERTLNDILWGILYLLWLHGHVKRKQDITGI